VFVELPTICPKCGAIVPLDASFCPICGAALQSQRSMPLSSDTPTREMKRSYATYGIITALLGLFILPELLCSIAIILGAYTWKMEEGNRGVYVLVLGIICMIIGIYLTAFV